MRRFAGAVVDVVSWPFERAWWVVEQWVVWPVREGLAGWAPSGRALGAGALAATGAAAVLVGVVVLSSGDGAQTEKTGGQARVAVVPAGSTQAQDSSGEPTLQGAPIHFGVGSGVGVAESGGSGSSSDSGGGSNATSDSSGGAAGAAGEGAASTEEPAAAASTAGKPVPAGPAAMDVARRFADAFVFYEIGQRAARAKAVFGETATEQLAEALEERPPRLPAGGAVPKARVLNLVPGPRFGKQYTVSVALLRVGVTSELRITLKKEKDGTWRVASILG